MNGNPLFNRLNPPQNQPNNILDRFGGLNGIQQLYQTLSRQQNFNPQQVVTQMMQNGMITQEQFNNAAMIANQLMGRKF